MVAALDPKTFVDHNGAVVSKKVVLGSIGAAAVGVLAGRAQAWEVFRSESGAPLRWSRPEVVLVLGEPPEGAGFGRAEARAALEGGLVEWRGLECGGPRLSATEGTGRLDPDDGVNRVVWVSDREEWTSRFLSTELARTILIYRVQSGSLVDTDIAVNLAYFEFAAGPECDAQGYDLQGMFAHELGHVVGLDHSAEPSATMAPNVAPGTCEQRTLSEDDRAGYCASYPRVEPGPEAELAPERVEVEPDAGVAEVVEEESRGRDEGCGGAPFGGLFGLVAAGLSGCGRRARRRNGR